MERECLKRGLKSSYQLVEERPASSMHPPYFVVEVSLSGVWTDLVDGKPQSKFKAKVFQGIGKTTREAKFKAASASLQKLRDIMPGLKVPAGIIPRDWQVWMSTNRKRGCHPAGLLRTLVAKGFHPVRGAVRVGRRALPAAGPRPRPDAGRAEGWGRLGAREDSSGWEEPGARAPASCPQPLRHVRKDRRGVARL